eukprot:jgi/Mesvir1/28713/Mv19683-RA.1
MGVKGHKPPAAAIGMAKTVKLDLKDMASLPSLMEPYSKPAYLDMTLRQRWLTTAGWMDKYIRFAGLGKSLYAFAKLYATNKGFSLKGFKSESSDLYQEMNNALAEGDLSRLRDTCTEVLLGHISTELKRRKAAGWTNVKWKLLGMDAVKVLQARMIAISKENPDEHAFVQVTVLYKARQSFAVYDKKGDHIMGDPEAELALLSLRKAALAFAVLSVAGRFAGHRVVSVPAAIICS